MKLKHVILTGLPGCGKTTLGRLLAAQTGIPFIDLDERISRAAGISISDIFVCHGEAHFRELESRELKRAFEGESAVIATGGGAVLSADNVDIMRKNGFVVFIDRPAQAIEGDIERQHRPLLKNGEKTLAALAQERRPIYLSSAHAVLENAGDIAAALETLEAFCAPMTSPAHLVIGDPIAHSLSPAIHNAVFSAINFPGKYGAVHVKPCALEGFVAGARAFETLGFNVTFPHKQRIIPFLDGISDDARLCEAVNTVVLKNGKLIGHNTDMDGLLLSLNRSGRGYEGSKLMLLGAGGASSAVALKAAQEGASEMRIMARDAAQREELARLVKKRTGFSPICGGFTPGELTSAAQESDLLINGTPLGMTGIDVDFADFAFLRALPKNALVCDLIYSPPKTRLLLEAKMLGLATMNGLGMLIYQAILADEIFTRKPLDREGLHERILHKVLPSAPPA